MMCPLPNKKEFYCNVVFVVHNVMIDEQLDAHDLTEEQSRTKMCKD